MKVNNNERQPSDSSNLNTGQRRYPVVLSIAGSDSSGGAGIQADIKTFSALGVYGATAITAITAQNTQGVHSQFALSPQMVHDQIVTVVEDISPSAIKIGMLSNAEIANAVSDTLMRYDIPIVLDPVMVSSSGHRLLSTDAQKVIKERLIPLSAIVTPNIPEMEALCAMPISTIYQKEAAARHLIELGAQTVLLKGGHEEGDIKIDILYQNTADGLSTLYLSSPTIRTKNIHGTGCTLSAAIAAFLARGYNPADAVKEAKEFISKAIGAGAEISIGQGYGPVNHLFDPQKMQIYEKR